MMIPNLKIMSLPEGEDPDSFVHKHGQKNSLNMSKMPEELIDYQYLVFEMGRLFPKSR